MFGIDNYEPAGWRQQFLPKFFSESQLDMDKTDSYEFGVFLGGSIVTIARAMRDSVNRTHRVIGFDSWEGIPPELAEPVYEVAWAADFKGDPNQVFHPSRWLDVSDPDQVMEWVRVNILSEIGGNFDLDLVRGWYDEILNGGIGRALIFEKQLKPSYYVDIDCDTYSSTFQSLKFLLDNKLVVPGTIIGFDDWGGAPNDQSKGPLGGEARAFYEISETYNMYGQMHDLTFYDDRVQQLVFIVEGIG